MTSKLSAVFLHIFAAATIFGSEALAAAGDPDNGQRLAKRWCASCHLVAPDQKQASADAPPFAAIARAPDFSREKIAYFLLDPHPKMPDMSLTRNEATDLAQYIVNLKNKQ